MATLTKKNYGDNAMKGVGLIISVYDSSKFTTKTGKEGQYISAIIHPDDPRAVGQTTPSLRFEPDPEGKRPAQTSFAFFADQMKALQENSETFPLTNKDGEVLGTNYVVQADLMVKSPTGADARSYLMPNSKTFTKSETCGVEVVDGKTPLDRIYDMAKEAKAARAAAAPEADAPEAKDDAAAKRSAAAKKAAATRRANKAKEAEAKEATAAEPELG